MSVVKKALSVSLIILMVFLCTLNHNSVSGEVSIVESVLPNIENASFEQVKLVDGQTDKYIPESWEFDCDINYLNTEIINANAYDGTKYYQVIEGEYLLKSTKKVSVGKNCEYTIGVKFLSSNLENSCSVIVETFNEQDEKIDIFSSQEKNAVKENAWTDVNVNFCTSEQVKNVEITIQIKAEVGSVGIDSVYAQKAFIKIYSGASLKLETSNPGIRFSAYVDKEIFDSFSSVYSEVGVGIIVMPTYFLEEIGDYTEISVKRAGRSASLINSEIWSNSSTAESDGCYKYTCALIRRNSSIEQIIDMGITSMVFCVRAYFTYVDNGQEKIIYSDYNLIDNSRSMQGVARKIKEDSVNYNGYDDMQKEIINAYIENRAPNFN